MHVLLVGGAPCLARAAAGSLRAAGHRVELAAADEDGRWLAEGSGFDALILAGDTAASLCAELRAAGVWTPILVLAAVCDGRCVAALDAGADDCESMPLRPEELEARLRALVRRGQPERPSVLAAGSLRLDPGTRCVTGGGERLPIAGLPFDLLELLLRRQGQVTTRGEIAEHVWDWAWESHSNAIDVHVHHLRSVLGSVPGAPRIATVRGLGYRLEDAPADASSARAAHRHRDSCSLHVARRRVDGIGRVHSPIPSTTGGDGHEALEPDAGDGGDHRVRRPGVREPRDLPGHPA